MTAQIPDVIRYEGRSYDITAVTGEGMVTVQQFGIEPFMLSTACWRGFYVAYVVEDSQLLLNALTVRARDRAYPPIGGVAAQVAEHEATYAALRLPVPFSGLLRVGADFIRELYIHMGFQKASSYRSVLDLEFSAGRLTAAHDRSADLDGERGKLGQRFAEGDIDGAIRDSFSLGKEID